MSRASKPSNYGAWWFENGYGPDWYAQLYAGRQRVHASFQRWVRQTEERDGALTHVLEVGCGCAVHYPLFFSDKRYVGIDISAKEIAWCQSNNRFVEHEYNCLDIIEEMQRDESQLRRRYDLVFSHAVIDHIYDIDAFLKALKECSVRWLYLTAYRGWFPELQDHIYTWSEPHTCFYNDLSPSRLREQLYDLGCRDVRVEARDTGESFIPQETVAIARVE